MEGSKASLRPGRWSAVRKGERPSQAASGHPKRASEAGLRALVTVLRELGSLCRDA